MIRCIITGTTIRLAGRRSSTIFSVASGSNLRWINTVAESTSPRLKWAKPQEWNRARRSG